MTAGALAPTLARLAPWLLLAGVVIAADQATKSQVVAVLGGPGAPASVPVTGYFNLVLAYNRGAAFSFLNGAGGWPSQLFTVVALGASAFIVWLLARQPAAPRFAAALGLILGGALGNALDRMRLGHVVDFLDFHWGWLDLLFAGGHFPAFNVADSAITCGAALLILDELLRALAARRA